MTVRILIADDHGVLRAALRAFLANEAGLEVIGEASSGDEALRLAQELCPDVVLLDISMPGKHGLEVTRAMREECPQTRVLILTASEETGIITEALRAGAAGYVVKRAVEAELISAIAAVMRGDVYVHPAVTRALVEATALAGARPADENPTPLTVRERQILVLLAQGFTNGQMSDRLGLSTRTVESHRANIVAKLHTRSRADLVRYAAEHGLLPDMQAFTGIGSKPVI